MNLSKLVKLMLCLALFGASASVQAADRHRKTATKSSRSRVSSRKSVPTKEETQVKADKATL
ncbi:MAG TPA: hypothetical protein VFF04_04015, partial [Candidatus Babeliales bacterium]|nr:hypothetical protein [Candidatus Babeliales bacterium]